MAVVEIKNLSITRGGREVVKNFSAKLKSGTITAIIGPNGSGKSTLLAALSGDIPISSGSIKIDGRELNSFTLAEQANMRSVVMQNRTYWLSYNVQEMVSMGQSHTAISKIDGILSALKMKDFAKQRVTTLSGGEAQRVEIARALIRDSDIYLFDEPLSAQDALSKKRVIDILKKLRDQGKTILIIAHIDRNALPWCDQIIDNFA